MPGFLSTPRPLNREQVLPPSLWVQVGRHTPLRGRGWGDLIPTKGQPLWYYLYTIIPSGVKGLGVQCTMYNSKESITPDYVCNRFLGFLKDLQIRAQSLLLAVQSKLTPIPEGGWKRLSLAYDGRYSPTDPPSILK